MGRDVGAGGAVAHVVKNLRANMTMSHDATDIRETAHASRAFHLLMALLPRLVYFITSTAKESRATAAPAGRAIIFPGVAAERGT